MNLDDQIDRLARQVWRARRGDMPSIATKIGFETGSVFVEVDADSCEIQRADGAQAGWTEWISALLRAAVRKNSN